MTLFSYKAVRAGGEELTGSKDAKDRYKLAEDLRKQGYTLTHYEEKKSGEGSFISKLQMISTVSVSEKMIFARNMSVMVGAGVSMTKALEVLSRQTSNKKFKTETNGLTITLKLAEESDAPTAITIRNKVLNATVKGVPDIERVTIVQKDNEWVIQTTGSNLAKVLEVEGIDKENVRTNNVFEIASTLGIEAARNALINELNSTLEDQGLEVDMRYIMLVADTMCSRGYMQQIGRHGIAGTKDSVLARAAFEITVPTIAHAALQGEIEQLKGVTENVIVGSNIPIGSGTVDLYMQVSKKN